MMLEDRAKPVKTFKTVLMYGLTGMLLSFMWILLSFIICSFLKENSLLERIIRIINIPLTKVAYLLAELASTPLDNIPIGLFIVLILNLIAGYLLGIAFYFIRQIFMKNRGGRIGKLVF